MLIDRFSVEAKLTRHYSQFSAVVKKKVCITQFISTTDGSLIVIENEALYCIMNIIIIYLLETTNKNIGTKRQKMCNISYSF